MHFDDSLLQTRVGAYQTVDFANLCNNRPCLAANLSTVNRVCHLTCLLPRRTLKCGPKGSRKNADMTSPQQRASLGIALTTARTRHPDGNIDGQNIGNWPLMDEVLGGSIKVVSDESRGQVLCHAYPSIAT